MPRRRGTRPTRTPERIACAAGPESHLIVRPALDRFAQMCDTRRGVPLEMLWKHIDRAAHRFLPPGERGDPDQVARAKFGVVAGLLFIAVALLRSVELFWLGVVGQAAVLAVAAGLVAFAPVVGKITGSFAAAAHFGVAIVALAIVGAAYASGGAASPALLVFMMVPFMAVFALGRRGGALWLAISVSLIAMFAVLEGMGRSPPIRYPLETWNLAKATAAFLLVLVTFLLSLTYERAKAQAHESANVSESVSGQQPDLNWLASSLNHEANNALAYIAADLEYVQSVIPKDDPEVASALGEARVGAARLRDIVRDVSTIAERRNAAAGDDSVDLESEFEAAMEAVRACGTEVRVVGVQSPGSVKIGSTDLQRVLFNVLTAGGVEADVVVTIGPGPLLRVEARGGSLPRPLAIAAAKRLVGSHGGSAELTRTDHGWSVRLELASSEH